MNKLIRQMKISEVMPQRCLLYGGALLIGINFVIPGFEWTVIIGLLPFYYYIDNISSVRMRYAYLDIYLSGLLIFCFANIFFLQIEPANWDFILPGWFSNIAGVSAWLLASLISALSFLLIPKISLIIENKTYRLAMLPFIWFVVELVGALFFSFISYGRGGSIGFENNFGSLASIASSLPVVFASRIVGFYGMSILVNFLALAIYLGLVKRQLKYSVVCLILPLGFIIGSYYLMNPKASRSRNLHVVVMHLNESDSLDKQINFSELRFNIDLFVLPEYSKVQKNPNFDELLKRLSPTGLLVTTKLEGQSPNATNDLIFINKQGAEISVQPKHRLIPGGEYMPYSLAGVFKLIGKQDFNELFKYSYQLSKGSNEISTVSYGGINLGALPCSGAISTSSYMNMVSHGAEVLINSASLSLLNEDSSYHVLAKRMALFQAVRNNRPFIQASRSGNSLIINPNGQIQGINSGSATQLIDSDILVD